MPLSEDEQRILREIEENLSATDPRLVQQVSDTTLYRHALRMIRLAIFGLVGGLVLLVVTFRSTLLLGVGGFAVMLASALVLERNLRKLGRAGIDHVTSSLRGGALKGRFGSVRDRWRERGDDSR